MVMRLSLYTFVKNGLFLDFHVEAMLRHHLPFVDEIVVDEGLSTDGTYDVIKNIDPKIKVFRNEWDRSDPLTWYIKFKNRARMNCTGDWCILLDCDEFIPEWEFERLRQLLSTTEKDILAVRMLHFYGNYKVHQSRTDREFPPKYKQVIHRNIPSIEVWGDGSDVRSVKCESAPAKDNAVIDVHHFGEVRHAARLRQKWREQTQLYANAKRHWFVAPSFIFDLFPHRWADPDVLPHLHLYKGPYIKAVRDNPSEFIRDNFALVRALERHSD